jgi:hypothetical protein
MLLTHWPPFWVEHTKALNIPWILILCDFGIFGFIRSFWFQPKFHLLTETSTTKWMPSLWGSHSDILSNCLLSTGHGPKLSCAYCYPRTQVDQLWLLAKSSLLPNFVWAKRLRIVSTFLKVEKKRKLIFSDLWKPRSVQISVFDSEAHVYNTCLLVSVLSIPLSCHSASSERLYGNRIDHRAWSFIQKFAELCSRMAGIRSRELSVLFFILTQVFAQ